MGVGRSARPSESALAQLSLRLVKLLRLSVEGRRDGELGGPEMVDEVGMSSTADEEELCVSVVSTDIVAATSRRSQRRRKCQRKGQRGAGAKRLGFGNWGGRASPRRSLLSSCHLQFRSTRD